MTHLDLFSGIGGFALAARWAGISTVGFCEIDDECRKVLHKHWPNTPIHNDIRTLDGESYYGVELVTGGYPCQPFSVAGGRKAQADPRHLWPEMCRVLAQAQPTWAICENVYGHIRLGLDEVLHDLEGIGYASQPFVIPSLATGANHRRERVFIVAYSPGNGRDESKAARSNEAANGNCPQGSNKNSNDEGCGGIRVGMDWSSEKIGRGGTLPPPLRVDAELPRRVDRNRMIGNAVDPVIAYQLMRAISQMKEQ